MLANTTILHILNGIENGGFYKNLIEMRFFFTLEWDLLA